MHNLIFVITGLTYGGAETQLVCLALQLKARGWTVQVVSLTPPKAYVEELDSAGIPLVSLGVLRKLPNPRPIFLLARLFQIWRPDIVHSHMVHANILARLVRPIVKVPLLICSVHSIYEGGRLRELLYRLTDSQCDLTTQVSKAGLERYVRVGIVPRNKICFIPNGVDTKRFHPCHESKHRLREELGLATNFGWLAVGRFDIPKDYSNMLKAFAIVAQCRPEARLIIVGDGPLRQVMAEFAKKLGLVNQVTFLGIRRDIPELMNAADGYVMSSSWEGMANVLLEASATGLPIVATDVGGNGEVVQNNKTGFLVRPKDPEALGGAMLSLMGLSNEERRQMGLNGRQYTEACYSMDRVADMWENLYLDLLSVKGFGKKIMR